MVFPAHTLFYNMTLKKSIITDKKYGRIEITRNPRARRIIMRVKEGCICITLPVIASEKEVQKILDKYGDRLLIQKNRQPQRKIDFEYSIDADNFSLRLFPGNNNRFQIKREDEQRFTLICPADCDFTDAKTNEFLRKVIKSVMRKRAKEVLPARLTYLAKKHGFSFMDVKVRDSHTRWGSCSNKGNISLSIYLMMLSNELIDYVLLHELCHTKEMNHSDSFWKLLHSVTASRAKALRAELKRHHTTF